MADERKREDAADDGEVMVDVPAVIDEDGNVDPVVSKVAPDEAEQIAEEEDDEIQEERAWYTIWWVWLIFILVFGFGFWGFGTVFWW